MTDSAPVVAVIGGTGDLGSAIAHDSVVCITGIKL
jgi:hypothetical protein